MKSRNSVKISFHNVFDALKLHLLSKFMQLSGKENKQHLIYAAFGVDHGERCNDGGGSMMKV